MSDIICYYRIDSCRDTAFEEQWPFFTESLKCTTLNGLYLTCPQISLTSLLHFNFIFSDTKMNLHHPCTSCQDENCECMELQLQLQGNIYKPLEGLKLIAGISLMPERLTSSYMLKPFPISRIWYQAGRVGFLQLINLVLSKGQTRTTSKVQNFQIPQHASKMPGFQA